MFAGRLAVLSDAAAEFPSADKFCSAFEGAAETADEDIVALETVRGVRSGDFSTSESLYRGLNLCIWNNSIS
jgi:hypothetical protein